MGLALTGCDKSEDYIVIQDHDKAVNSSVIVNVKHFPEYVSVNGVHLHPDDNPVSGAGTDNAMYEFKVELKTDDYSYHSLVAQLMRDETHNPISGIGWITEQKTDKQPVIAWRESVGKFYYGTYSDYQSNVKDTPVIIGYVKGWD